MRAKFLFLGTGGSMGIPIVSCKCSVCSSPSQFNKRLRPSALLTVEDKNFIIDVGPDFRAQALHYKIDKLDGVLLTHTHYDHIGGMDDLRVFYFLHKKRLPTLLSQETYEELKLRFHYFFQTKTTHTSPRAQLDIQVLEGDFGETQFEGLTIKYVSYYQKEMKVTGFIFGGLAYISDISRYDPELITRLQGIDILILSALRYTRSEVHFSVQEAVDFSRSVKAKRTFLTHIAHDLEHDETSSKLPEGISLAHDGLEISFDL